MGFWIYMLCMELLLPLLMIVIGAWFLKAPPKHVNIAFGYRTAMSMKNKDTWAFAHAHCGKLWKKLGWIMLPVSLAAMLFVYGGDKDTVGNLGAALLGLQVLVLVASLIPTERALKKAFDEQGRRRREET